METLLMAIVDTGRRSGVVKATSIGCGIVNTTGMPKAMPIRRTANHWSEVAST